MQDINQLVRELFLSYEWQPNSSSTLVDMEQLPLSWFFNLMGMLSVKRNNSDISLSKPYALQNILKICVLICFANHNLRSLHKNFLPSASTELYHSQFTALIIFPHAFEQVALAAITIFLQLVKSKQNIDLINLCSSLQSIFVEKYPSTKPIFENSRSFYLKQFMVIWGLTTIFFTTDMIILMESTLMGVLSYLAFNFPNFINIAFLCYFYFFVQFMLACQKALNLCIATSVNNRKSRLQDVSSLQTLLFTFRQHFVSTLSWQIFLLIINYSSEVLFEVIFRTSLSRF